FDHQGQKFPRNRYQFRPTQGQVFCLKSRARLLGTPCRQRVLRDRFPSNPACESCRLRTVVYSPTTRENAHEDRPHVMSGAHISPQKYREVFQSSTAFQIPSGLADGYTRRARSCSPAPPTQPPGGPDQSMFAAPDHHPVPIATTLISARKKSDRNQEHHLLLVPDQALHHSAQGRYRTNHEPFYHRQSRRFQHLNARKRESNLSHAPP